jgi:hypothetical protein
VTTGRRRAAVGRGERGSSIIEFSVIGILGFGLLLQVVVLFGILHRATLATSAGARELGRVVVLADSEADADARAAAVVAQVERDHGLPAGSVHARIDGRVARGEVLRVAVSTDVAVFRLPFVGGVIPALHVPVEATHVVQVDRYRSFGGSP